MLVYYDSEINRLNKCQRINRKESTSSKNSAIISDILKKVWQLVSCKECIQKKCLKLSYCIAHFAVVRFIQVYKFQEKIPRFCQLACVALSFVLLWP